MLVTATPKLRTDAEDILPSSPAVATKWRYEAHRATKPSMPRAKWRMAKEALTLFLNILVFTLRRNVMDQETWSLWRTNISTDWIDDERQTRGLFLRDVHYGGSLLIIHLFPHSSNIWRNAQIYITESFMDSGLHWLLMVIGSISVILWVFASWILRNNMFQSP